MILLGTNRQYATKSMYLDSNHNALRPASSLVHPRFSNFERGGLSVVVIMMSQNKLPHMVEGPCHNSTVQYQL